MPSKPIRNFPSCHAVECDGCVVCNIDLILPDCSSSANSLTQWYKYELTRFNSRTVHLPVPAAIPIGREQTLRHEADRDGLPLSVT